MDISYKKECAYTKPFKVTHLNIWKTKVYIAIQQAYIALTLWQFWMLTSYLFTEITSNYNSVQGVFSRNGLTLWLEKPTKRQSSCSCSVIYLMMSLTAKDTGIRLIAPSRRSCSVIQRCCWRFETTMSINAVSERPMVNNFT